MLETGIIVDKLSDEQPIGKYVSSSKWTQTSGTVMLPEDPEEKTQTSRMQSSSVPIAADGG